MSGDFKGHTGSRTGIFAADRDKLCNRGCASNHVRRWHGATGGALLTNAGGQLAADKADDGVHGGVIQRQGHRHSNAEFSLDCIPELHCSQGIESSLQQHFNSELQTWGKIIVSRLLINVPEAQFLLAHRVLIYRRIRWLSLASINSLILYRGFHSNTAT